MLTEEKRKKVNEVCGQQYPQHQRLQSMRTHLYSTSRWSKLCDASTQWRNLVKKTYQCLLDAIIWNSPRLTADSGKPTGLLAHAYLPYTAPGMYHTMKLQYSIDNPDEIMSTAVYPPSWNRIDSVHKIANATLQWSHNLLCILCTGYVNITFIKQPINALVIRVTSLRDLVGIQVLAYQLHLIIHCIGHLRIHLYTNSKYHMTQQNRTTYLYYLTSYYC